MMFILQHGIDSSSRGRVSNCDFKFSQGFSWVSGGQTPVLFWHGQEQARWLSRGFVEPTCWDNLGA